MTSPPGTTRPCQPNDAISAVGCRADLARPWMVQRMLMITRPISRARGQRELAVLRWSDPAPSDSCSADAADPRSGDGETHRRQDRDRVHLSNNRSSRAVQLRVVHIADDLDETVPGDTTLLAVTGVVVAGTDGDQPHVRMLRRDPGHQTGTVVQLVVRQW